MKEKVVSLSGGLVLGMVCALFLGIGATQNMTRQLHFEIPSIMQMTIAQASHSTPTPANDTTPVVNVAAPVNEDRGRITRIATVTETTDPVFSSTTTTTAQAEPKNWENASTPKIENTLQRTNLQRSYIAANLQTEAYISLGHTAGQSNFSSIACNSSGRNEYYGGQTPSFIDDKPQTHGSPASAQDDPDENEGEQPALSGKVANPGPGPDSFEDNNTREPVDPERVDHTFSLSNDNNNSDDDNYNPDSFQDYRRRRPETD